MDNSIFVMKNNHLETVDVDFPKPVAPASYPLFEDMVNAEVLTRYARETDAKLNNGRKQLATIEEKLIKLDLDKTAEDYAEKRANLEKAREKKMADNAAQEILAAEIVEKNIYEIDLSDAKCCELADVFALFCMRYSTAAQITYSEKGIASVTPYEISGVKSLYGNCRIYNKKYSDVTEWTEERTKDFKTLKSQLATIGKRLEGDATENRTYYKYEPTSKDVNRLIAAAGKHYKTTKSGGTKSEDNLKYEGFEDSVIATLFHEKDDAEKNSKSVLI